MYKIISCLLLFWIVSNSYASQSLPILKNISHIEVSGHNLDAIVIVDADKINKITSFFNHYQSSWSIPAHPVGAANLMFSFFSNNEYITEIGLSPQFISQLYGNHWSQPVSKNIIKQFAGNIHPAIEENLFPIIPVDLRSKNKLIYWEQKLSQLKPGIDHHEIQSFIRENNIRIKHVNNNTAGNNYWLNLELSLVNDGDYVDTVIAAKLYLNKNHSLKSSNFLGYQLSKKTSSVKRLTSNMNAANF